MHYSADLAAAQTGDIDGALASSNALCGGSFVRPGTGLGLWYASSMNQRDQSCRSDSFD